MLLCVAWFPASAATAFPFLTPIRTEILGQIASLNDTNLHPILTAQERTQLRALLQARNLLSRRGRASLAGDLQMLSTLSLQLGRLFPQGEFEPLLDDAVVQYQAVLTSTSSTLATNINRLPPSQQTATAAHALESIDTTLAQVDSATSTVAAARLLSRAALRLVAVQALVARLLRDIDRPMQMTAFVDASTFRSGPASTSATFHSDLGLLTVTGTQTTPGTRDSRTITLSMANVHEGTTTHQFGSVASGTFALYTRRGTNTVGFTSSSGFAIVTVDSAAGTISGTFSFMGNSLINLDPPATVSGGNFFVRLP